MSREKDLEPVNPQVYKRERKKNICKETGKCPLCPMHSIENYNKRPRNDRYKNKR